MSKGLNSVKVQYKLIAVYFNQSAVLFQLSFFLHHKIFLFLFGTFYPSKNLKNSVLKNIKPQKTHGY